MYTINKLGLSLTKLGANLRPAADHRMISIAESVWKIRAPVSAVVLYKFANGADGEFGRWMWRFWGVDTRRLTLGAYLGCENKELFLDNDKRSINPSQYVRFFDCVFDAPLYAYCADPNSLHFGEVIGCWIDDGPEHLTGFAATKSIEKFLELAINSEFEEMLYIDE